MAKRDALIEELSRVYPTIEEQLVDLLDRVAENNDRIECANRSRSFKTLRSAEDVARGYPGGPPAHIPRLTMHLRLPAWSRADRSAKNGSDRWAWHSGSL